MWMRFENEYCFYGTFRAFLHTVNRFQKMNWMCTRFKKEYCFDGTMRTHIHYMLIDNKWIECACSYCTCLRGSCRMTFLMENCCFKYKTQGCLFQITFGHHTGYSAIATKMRSLSLLRYTMNKVYVSF